MTTAFDPTVGSLGAYALGRCNIRRTAIDMGHLTDVAMAANLVLSDFSTDEPNLWGVTLNSINLVQGTATYTLPANVLLMLDVYLRVTQSGTATIYELDGFGNQVLDGFGNPIILVQGTTTSYYDRILWSVSRTEYASYPNKNTQAPPTTFWADRVVPIQLTIYPTPDGNGPYTLYYYCVQQDQDALLPAAGQMSIPYRTYNAFADALSAKLALTYAPERFTMLESVAGASYARMRGSENENVALFIAPGLNGFYR